MQQRNGALDLLRALAIAAVVSCHVYTYFEPGGPLTWAFGLGGRGVDLFFLLSGWLLGQQLAVERHRTGTIDLRRFWLRRELRILPAYYVVLGMTVGYAVYKSGWDRFDPAYWVFIQNYRPMPYFGISWSLCVEEHFYLFVGPLVLLAGRSRWGRWAILSLLAVPSVCRAFAWYGDIVETHVRFDQCGLGVMLAWFSVERPAAWRVLCRAAPLIAAGLTITAAGIGCAGFAWPGGQATETPFWTLVFGSWVLLANSGRGWIERLHFRPIRFVAERAYALYLLHPDAVAVTRRIGLLVGDLPTGVEFVLVWVIGLLAAHLLFQFVELPGMRLRERFALTRSAKGKSERGRDLPGRA